jgi:chemotaxis protein methyltransferase CheR
MPFAPDHLGLPATGLPLLRDLVHERTGLFYDNGRCDTLADRLAPLVLDRGFRTFLDFYYLLKYDERAAPAEWRRVVDALSVQETYFWREVDQIRGLACRVLPELAREGGSRPVRIWSAPCATGEEPLSIAIALEEAGWFNRLPIEIHASDVSASAIARAVAGRYGERSFRALPAELRARYFVAHDGKSSPVPALRERVTSWSIVNLMAREELLPYATSPIVFCRNAFIYFSRQSVSRVVDAFADLMPAPGFLFLGASESLLNVTDRFRLEEIGGAFVYVKRE